MRMRNPGLHAAPETRSGEGGNAGRPLGNQVATDGDDGR